MHAPPPVDWQPLVERFPGREQQIRALATLVDPGLAPCGNVVVHGTEATGKSAVTTAVLERLATARRRGAGDGPDADSDDADFAYALVDSNKCVTARHLFERTVAEVAASVRAPGPAARRCETLAQLTVELSKLLQPAAAGGGHFALVFDAVDRQRDAPATLLPGLARLSEMIPNLTTVFVVTLPSPAMLRTSFVPHVHFGNYSRAEFVAIASRVPPPPPALPHASPAEAAELWARLCTAVHDALTRTAGRTLPAFQDACAALWPKFTAPVAAGTHGPREFAKLLIAARAHFQDEALLDPGAPVASAAALAAPDTAAAASTALPSSTTALPSSSSTTTPPAPPAARHLAALLPTTARLFLLCAYLASHNAARHDLTLFSTYHHGRKRRRGGMSVGASGLSAVGGGRRAGRRAKHRKIARKLLGAHSFPLERLLAIFAAVRSEWTQAAPLAAGGRHAAAAVLDADCHTALATLASLRLVVRVGGPASDPIDRAGKWRVNVGWEVVRSLGRSMGVEMEDWLVD